MRWDRMCRVKRSGQRFLYVSAELFSFLCLSSPHFVCTAEYATPLVLLLLYLEACPQDAHTCTQTSTAQAHDYWFCWGENSQGDFWQIPHFREQRITGVQSRGLKTGLDDSFQ